MDQYDDSPVTWSDGASTLLPSSLAYLISGVIKAVTLMLRVVNYGVGIVLDLARVSCLTVMRFGRRGFESAVLKANDEVYGAELWVDGLMKRIDQVAIFINLCAAVTFHAASSGVHGLLVISQDALHLLNGVFGASETSRALNSVFGLLWNEISKNNGFCGMVSGILYLVVLQSRGWKRSGDRIKHKQMWNVVVLENGQVVAKDNQEEEITKIVELMPTDCQYKIGINETHSRVYDVELGLKSGQKMDLPSDARVISEQIVKRDNQAVYKIKFESQSWTKMEQTGKTPSTAYRVQSKDFPAGSLAKNIARYMRCSSASYGNLFLRFLGISTDQTRFPKNDSANGEHYSFAHHARINIRDIFLSSYIDNSVAETCGIPLVHFAAFDHQAQAVVLTIRGTWGLQDVLADFTFAYKTVEWQGITGKAHEGMLKCATALTAPKSKLMHILFQALSRHETYGLVVCGHSLGGGVGALMVTLLSEKVNEAFQTRSDGPLPPGRRIKCFSYGSPAAMTNNLREATRGVCTSVVYGLDIVPCLSLGLIKDYQAVSAAVQADPKGAAWNIAKRLLSQMSTRRDPLQVHDELYNDHLWSILKTLRAVMQSEKLLPPGEVVHINTATSYETGRKATRITGSIVIDVASRFGEPLFGRGVLHHSPIFYERVLTALEEALD